MNIQEQIASLMTKRLQITLSGKIENLQVIDWKTIVEKHEALMEQIEEMEDEEAGDYLIEHESELMQITENFMNDACDEKVEDEKWLPFGLLGLPDDADNFAVTKNNGLLVLDLTKAKTGTIPVLHFYKGKTQVVATSLEELQIEEM
ncbi:MAG: hypothetical protein K0R51_458 [Cytophagaceae bacterium]|jgi:hypothetical protein|nr:hypothetical protein [Cytophagaceae bacterium]